ncbi:serine/threonine protein kinase [Streptomyces lonarensis]|uniref:non-specific serine/threonine protein kinase n=1 Tax=Streptomyces lonarensis TaxID=700599 RepID=A0A7X6D5A0_9ACTN|nr:serine/threonine protein kinase [Streptomyces lonarensis]
MSDASHLPGGAARGGTAGVTPVGAPTASGGSGGRSYSELADDPSQWGRGGTVGDGRYRLTRRLGRGGMADVFAAEDVRLGRLVAVKLLRPDLAEDQVAKARFTREAQSVAGLNHHAVVAVYDSGEEDTGGVHGTVPYIVMELVTGHTIRELLINEDAQPTERALSIVSGVLEALAYSHQHGIVHRDIKPANVIITETGSVKVMDFGIARALHGVQSTMTQTGMVMGTPQYLSPEQALGKAVDTRSDLYAVGCLLYELLTQRPPFTGETPLSVVYQHVQDLPRLPSEVSQLSPPELNGLVMRSLAKDPDDRFQTAEEMRSLIQYAVRMLETHGGHTAGLWNTGAAMPETPAMGTAAMSSPPPTQVGPPLLLGNPGGDDTPAGGRPPVDPTTNRLRYVLVALLVIAAIVIGIFIAVNAGNDEPVAPPDQGERTDPPEGTDPEEPEEEPEEEEEPPPEDPPEQDWNQTTGSTTSPAPGNSSGYQGGGSSNGGSDGTSDGTTEGETEGTSEGDTEGTNEGTPGGETEGAPGGDTEGAPGGESEGAPGGEADGGGGPGDGGGTTPPDSGGGEPGDQGGGGDPGDQGGGIQGLLAGNG